MSDTEVQFTITNREREVAELISCGLRSKEIARKLKMNPRTVDQHITNMRNKTAMKHARIY